MRAFQSEPAREPVARVAVTVTFLRMDSCPLSRGAALPPPVSMARVARPTVQFYRHLYDTVGAPYCWWLRRAMPDDQISSLIGDPLVTIDVLYEGGQPAGFYEIDRRVKHSANLSYFGLFPHMVGRGLGPSFLRVAVDQAWLGDTRSVTVNTCTADHRARCRPTSPRASGRSGKRRKSGKSRSALG